MIKYLYKQKFKNGKLSRVWRARVRIADSPELHDFSTGLTDHDAAKKELARKVVEYEKEYVGDLKPKKIREAAAQPLQALLAGFLKHLEGLKKTPKYIKLTKSRLEELFAACKWKYFRDINVADFDEWRSSHAEDRSVKTINHYIGHAKTFIYWMEENDMSKEEDNPLKRLKKVSPKGHETRLRRELTINDIWRLIHIPDEYRGLAYFMAIATGLRHGELRALMWADIHFEAKSYISVRAATTKTHEKATIPLIPLLAQRLLKFKGKCPNPSGKVFFNGVPRARRLKEDLESLGIKYRNELDQYADFHALRHTCATLLSRANVIRKDASEFMRHRDSRQTEEVYTHTNAQNIFGAAEQLAALFPSEEPSHLSTQGNDIQGQNMAEYVQMAKNGKHTEIPNLATSGKGLADIGKPCQTSKKLEVAGVEPASR
jgi:integrase